MTNRRKRLAGLFLVLSMQLAAGSSAAAELTCASSSTLEALATCIRSQMPQSGSNGFVTPTGTQQLDWRWTIAQMLGGLCDFTLPASLAGIAQVKSFTDTGNGRSYCVLMEVADANGNGVVDRGLGTFIAYNGATRELSHQAPHPISDSTTEIQAVTIFKQTDSRSYLLAGAHRHANAATSTCQSGYQQADAAHNTANMFHATNLALLDWYGANAWTAIQWHGMAADSCPNTDVYLSHGRSVSPAPGDRIVELRNNALAHHPLWDIDVPGSGACSLNATDNTQGRLLNGVAAASVCGTAASSYTGRFIHIEQDPAFRNPADWIGPIRDTWPVVAPPAIPAAPSALSATAVSSSRIDLGWVDNAANEDGFGIERSTDNVSFSEIATAGISATSYASTGLAAATTYYYRVRAHNTGGYSGYSNTASATTQPAPPATPTGLNATAGDAQVTLGWNAAAGAGSYTVKRSSVSGGPYAAIATGVSATTYVDTGLSNGTTYYYVVSAVSGALESANSAQVAATPSAPAAPAPPTALKAQSTNRSIKLSWTKSVSANLAQTKVYRSTVSGGPYTNIATLAATATSHTDSSLTRRTTYYYVVSAVNSSGVQSAYSNQVSKTAQ